MDEAERLTRQLAHAARSMQGEAGMQGTLDMAATVATEVIGDCDIAGVSIVSRDGIDTPVASGEELRLLDELQYELGQGPCFDTLREHETVHSPDLATDERWPKWGSRVADELGVRSVLSCRLFTTRDTLGAMNLYSHRPDAFDHEDVYVALALSAHVAVALADAQNAEQMERAVSSRTVIGQAEGILMERFDISAEQAFEVLRRVSQDGNVKLNQVAADLVRTRRTPGADAG